MAACIPNSPEAMVALSMTEEASITDEELFEPVTQEVLK